MDKEAFFGTEPSVREKRRSALLDTAEAVFLAKGYEAATVNDILAAANLSKGGFYHYFKSKAEVLDALRVRYTDWFLHTVEARVNALPANAFKERFTTWVRAYVEAYLATYAVHDLVYHSVHAHRANEDRVAVTRSIEKLLEAGVADGTWRLHATAGLTAIIIYSAIHGVADETIADRKDDLLGLSASLCASLLLMLQPQQA